MTDHKALRLVDVLRDQRQCDEDGVMCIVSRQAVDEAVQIIESLTAAPAASEGGSAPTGHEPPPDDIGPYPHGGRWECFADASYFDKWCVRPKDSRAFGSGFHVNSQQEAEALVGMLEAGGPKSAGAIVCAESDGWTWDGCCWVRPPNAASEGEGGLMPVVFPVRSMGGKVHWPETFRKSSAAQVAATPKHDEGRIAELEAEVERLRHWNESVSVCPKHTADIVSFDGCVLCALDEYDPPTAALATQPAARRVTDRQAEVIAFLLGEGPLDGWWYGDRPHKGSSLWWRKVLRESFAQPAEGVSGG